MRQRQRALIPLDELADFTVLSGDPDPRGWSVTTLDGGGIGHAADLVVDTTEMKTRFLDVVVLSGRPPRPR
jgi:hypothetical protein